MANSGVKVLLVPSPHLHNTMSEGKSLGGMQHRHETTHTAEEWKFLATPQDRAGNFSPGVMLRPRPFPVQNGLLEWSRLHDGEFKSSKRLRCPI
jgi:hypothetical protein